MNIKAKSIIYLLIPFIIFATFMNHIQDVHAGSTDYIVGGQPGVEGIIDSIGSGKAEATIKHYKVESTNDTAYCADIETDYGNIARKKVSIVDFHTFNGTDMSKKEITEIAIGVSYLENSSDLGSIDTVTRRALAQAYIWFKIGNKKGVKGGYRSVSFNNGIDVSLWIDKANEYAKQNLFNYVGRGVMYVPENNTQRLCRFWAEPIPKTNFYIKKVSADKKISEANPKLYSLKNAEYTVYDENMTNVIGILKTDENGISNSLQLLPKTYKVKETKAPKGYVLDKSIYTVTADDLSGKKDYVLNLHDTPQYVPFDFKLIKKAHETASKDLSLKDAHYRIYYFNDIFTAETSPDLSQANLKWDFRTDSEGIIKIDEKHKIGGDPLYKDVNGKNVAPLGTYIIKEIKAPKGFLTDKNNVFTFIVFDNNGHLNTNMTNEVIHIEYPKKVILSVHKLDKLTRQNKPTGHAKDLSCTFGIYKKDNPDILIEKITTDKQGFGSSRPLDPDIYILKELIAPGGYIAEKPIEVDMRYTKEQAITHYSTKVTNNTTTVRINKISGIDKKPLKGALLAVYDGDTELERWISDGKPHEIRGLTIGKKYILKEVKPPHVYKKGRDIKFTLNNEDIIINYENNPVSNIPKTGDSNKSIIYIITIIVASFLLKRKYVF